jgi:hypothetical protein
MSSSEIPYSCHFFIIEKFVAFFLNQKNRLPRLSFIIIFFFHTIEIRSQDNLYVATNGTLYTHPGAQMGIFGNIINDNAGGLNHNNGGTVYFYRSASTGSGNSRIYDGPSAPVYTGNYNTNGAYVRFYNWVTDNSIGTNTASGTLINSTSGQGQIQVEQEVRVTNLHTFTNGMIWTPRGNWKHAFVHYDANGASYSGNNDSRHIDGYAAKTGSSNFDFPIGDGVRQRISGLSSPANGIYKSAYFNQNPQTGSTGISGPSTAASPLNGLLTKISTHEFWDIDGTAASQYKLTALNSVAGYSEWANDFITFGTCFLQIAAWDGMWENLSINAAPASVNSDGPFISIANPTNPDNGNSYGTGQPFTAYTWGISVYPKPLSIQLLGFTAVADACIAKLEWNTSNEINVDRFEMEQSINGINYSIAGTVTAKNGAGLNNYSINVSQPNKTNYYRIKIIGADGQTTYSSVQQVKTNCTVSNNYFIVYPNPVRNGMVQVRFNAEKPGSANLSMFDAMGQIVLKNDIIINQGDNNIRIDVDNLAKGTYVIQLFSASGGMKNQAQKIVIQ